MICRLWEKPVKNKIYCHYEFLQMENNIFRAIQPLNTAKTPRTPRPTLRGGAFRALILGGDPASGSLTFRVRSPRLCMVHPLSGLSRFSASVRIWPDERYGVGGNDSITAVCQVQAGNAALSLWERGAGGEGSHSRLSASVRMEEALIIGQEEKSTVFFRLTEAIAQAFLSIFLFYPTSFADI